MGPINTRGIAELLFLGLVAALLIAGGMAGFLLASVINLGKLCL